MKRLILFLFFTIFSNHFSTAGDNATSVSIEEGFTQINGTQLFYKIIGKGTPIVILHGGPGLDHSYLLPQMAELAKTHKLIFFDQRASGKSSVDSDTNSMTMKNLVEDVEGIRKAFKLG
ncbi:MAG: alpha/beta fold hydrolase, partial [Bacteroidota bacterium]